MKRDQVEVDQLGSWPDLPVSQHNILVVTGQSLLDLLKVATSFEKSGMTKHVPITIVIYCLALFLGFFFRGRLTNQLISTGMHPF